MEKLSLTILVVTMLTTIGISQSLAQENTVSVQTKNEDIIRRHSIGSSLFLLGNFGSGDPVYFFQLNYGYRVTPKDNLLCEAITWTYYEPLGGKIYLRLSKQPHSFNSSMILITTKSRRVFNCIYSLSWAIVSNSLKNGCLQNQPMQSSTGLLIPIFRHPLKPLKEKRLNTNLNPVLISGLRFKDC